MTEYTDNHPWGITDRDRIEDLEARIAVLKDRISRAEDAAVGHRRDMVDTFDRLANVIKILTEEDV